MSIRLLAGTEKGLFVLDSDDRREWRLGGPHHKGWQVYSLYRDPRDGAIYAGLSNSFFGPHLQRSRDHGDSWASVEGGPTFSMGSPRMLKQVWSVAAGAVPGQLWAGVSEAALFRSEDDGETWALNEGLEMHPSRIEWQPGAGGLCLHTILQDAADPRRIFVGISAVGVFRSDDGGHSWAVKNEGVGAVFPDETRKFSEIARCVHKFVQDPTDPNRLYQQNHTGVYRTLDAGDRWERIENGLPTGFGFPMVMHPRQPRTLFIVPQESDQVRMFPEGRPGVYRTTDGGDSWTRTHRGISEPSYSGVLRNSMTADGEEQPGVYFGTTGGEIYCTVDDGDSWQRLPGSLPRIQSLTAISR